MINFMDSQNFINLIKNNACLGVGSCIDLILTNREYFKNTSFDETRISDHHHLIFLIIKAAFASEEAKKFVYRDYKNFSRESLKNDLMSKLFPRMWTTQSLRQSLWIHLINTRLRKLS